MPLKDNAKPQKTAAGLLVTPKRRLRYPRVLGKRDIGYWSGSVELNPPDNIPEAKYKVGDYVWLWNPNRNMAPSNVGMVVALDDLQSVVRFNRDGLAVSRQDYKSDRILLADKKLIRYGIREHWIQDPIHVGDDFGRAIVITERQYKEVLKYAKMRKVLRRLRIV